MKAIENSQIARIDRVHSVIDNPTEYSYLRLNTNKKIIVLKVLTWGAASIEFKMAEINNRSQTPNRKISRIDYYKAFNNESSNIKVSKMDLKEAICEELEKCGSIPVINENEAFQIYDGFEFNGVDFTISGYVFAQKGTPAKVSTRNIGLPIVIDSIKSIDGIAEIPNQPLPWSLGTNKMLKVNIETEKLGNNQSYEFALYVKTAFNKSSVCKFSRKNKKNSYIINFD